MALSVSEKKELRSIIAARLTTRITQLKQEHKDVLATLAERARVEALAQLGIANGMAHLDILNEQKTALERDIDTAEAVVYDHIKHVEHLLYHTRPERIKEIISRTQKPIEEALFQATPLGQEVAALLAEQSRLEETVWAATSPRQVSEIFQALNTLLDERPTALEQAAHDLQHPET